MVPIYLPRSGTSRRVEASDRRRMRPSILGMPKAGKGELLPALRTQDPGCIVGRTCLQVREASLIEDS